MKIVYGVEELREPHTHSLLAHLSQRQHGRGIPNMNIAYEVIIFIDNLVEELASSYILQNQVDVILAFHYSAIGDNVGVIQTFQNDNLLL